MHAQHVQLIGTLTRYVHTHMLLFISTIDVDFHCTPNLQTFFVISSIVSTSLTCTWIRMSLSVCPNVRICLSSSGVWAQINCRCIRCSRVLPNTSFSTGSCSDGRITSCTIFMSVSFRNNEELIWFPTTLVWCAHATATQSGWISNILSNICTSFRTLISLENFGTSTTHFLSQWDNNSFDRAGTSPVFMYLERVFGKYISASDLSKIGKAYIGLV